MSRQLLTAAMVALLVSSSASYAGTIVSGSYTATATETSGTANYAPTITDDLSSSFSQTLSVGKTSTPTNFITVAPQRGNYYVGTVAGQVNVAFTFSKPSAIVTSVSNSAGGNPATLVHGMVDVSANYKLFYNTETDCISWSTTACMADEQQNTTIGDVVTVNFSDGAVLAINLYNWADWNMTPDISFTLVRDPTAVPEPMSVALLGSAMIGLGLLRRERKGASVSVA